MQTEVYQATAGRLLHDIGKVIFRALSLDGRAHSQSGYEAMKEIIDQPEILDCIRYHHKKELSGAKLDSNALAYTVYIADNIAAGADRRTGEAEEDDKGFDKTLPLENIFNLMNDNKNRYVHAQGDMNLQKTINFPQPKESVQPYTASKYNSLYQELRFGLQRIGYTEQYIDSLLALLESYMTYIPSSTNKQEVADISLYDHSKMTGAIAACIYLYLTEQNRTDFHDALYKNEKAFLDEKAFLMFSCDMSGIQSFIYTTSGEGALKALRARSLYLEILLEHIADEILQAAGLSRANLIYTGGGHAYILLPNTQAVRDTLTQISKDINQWFIQNFDNDLYLAMAWQPCSGNDLMNKGAEKDAYQQIFRQLSGKLGAKKISRYTADELMMLNQNNAVDDKRECKECKRSVALTKYMDDNTAICAFCDNIRTISNELLKPDSYFAILRNAIAGKGALPMPKYDGSTVYLQVLSEKEMKEFLKESDVVRFYSKNNQVTGQTMATYIWMGEYHVRGDYSVASVADLAKAGKGVQRIGVLRADVDNLGQAFVSGFLRKNEEDPAKYLTISRTATLSRSLSRFFKYHLNGILDGTAELPTERFSLEGTDKTAPRQVMIIYSGGDDLFIVGAWNEIIECAMDIQKAFSAYAQDTLTISAGIGIFGDSYPLIRMAEETGGLEDAAKKIAGGDKNAIALFGEDRIAHTYHWDIFEQKVVGEKLRFLQTHLGTKQDGEDTNTAFLYQMLNLLRNAEEQINLARFAYALARRVDKREDNEDKKAMQREFCDKMYAWYLNEEDRNQLITAIYLYVYLYRN
ncbi:MAG: type III-A CRISPR-associated protein Cas10/Csm1 [Peptococcaceae bacterium]|nr:type III-A CRISPR-associated protein Cas10/Csm1 [Peptococcaceae bacterium]